MINKSFVFYRDYLPGTFGKKLINFSKKYKKNLGQEIVQNVSSLDTNYYVSESIPNNDVLNLKNNRGYYLEDQSFIYLEYPTEISQSETIDTILGNTLNLDTNYYVSESIATGSTVAYQNYNYVYLEDNSYLLLD